MWNLVRSAKFRRIVIPFAIFWSLVILFGAFYDDSASQSPNFIPKPQVKSVRQIWMGENGSAVIVNATLLSSEDSAKYYEGYKKHAFNEFASNLMSLHRSLPDPRDPLCKEQQFDINVLPDTSVIICFHNEAWSTLLRTVYSVLDRSPDRLIKEIILVDDDSSFPELGKQLDEYVHQNWPKVKIVRTGKRQGLIRARLLGVEQATGSVLTFLDSHCEATVGWLEPLLYEIYKNSTRVVAPVIDVIDDVTMEYLFDSTKQMTVGGFGWNLQFSWHSLPKRLEELRETGIEPVPSPTMAGGLFSISRRYFDLIGTYDEQMDVWGMFLFSSFFSYLRLILRR